MSRKTVVFISALSIVSLTMLLYSILNITNQNAAELLYWVFLAALCESFAVFIKKDRAISVTFAIILASQLTHGTYFTIIVAAGSILFSVVKKRQGDYEHTLNRPYYKTLFNMSNFIISSFIPGIIYESMLSLFSVTHFPLTLILLPVYIIIYYLCNSSTLALLLSFINNETFFTSWKATALWAVLSFIAIVPFGYFIYELHRLPYGKVYFLLLLGPLLLARYSFKLYLDSKNQYYKTIKTLTAAIEAKDQYTEGHSRRVEAYAEIIAKTMKLSESKIESIKVAALLHDIGKIGIEDSILRKPGPLTEDEWKKVREHPDIGVKILEDVEFPDNIKDLIRYHHEKYDGSGYPLGLQRDEIPIEAYILAAADAYDAMTTDRPYRGALSQETVINIIEKDKGTHFHPLVADVLVQILKSDKLESVRRKLGYAT